jgi:CHAD domain-containing protein
MVPDTGAAPPDRRREIADFKANIRDYSAHEGVKLFALQQIKKATSACNHLTDPSMPDALHDFRVAVRRLRTWIRVYKQYHNVNKKKIKQLGDITDFTNKSRDLEVCLDWLNQCIADMSDISAIDKQALEILRENMTKDYKQELIEIQNHVPADWKRLQESLVNHLNNNIDEKKILDLLPQVAATKILSACKSVEDQLALIHGIEDRFAIHKLRIYYKRLRYLLEPFRFQIPATREIINFLKKIQDLLGNFRDAHIALELLSSHYDGLSEKLRIIPGDYTNSKIFAILFERARKLELDRFDTFRKLYVNGDLQRIVSNTRIACEELKNY